MYTEIMFLAALQAGIMAIALIAPRPRAYAERLLGVLVGVIGVEITMAAVVFSGELEGWPHLLQINTPLGFLYGPLCYWFCVASTDDRFRVSRGALWHLLPALAVAVYFLPLFVATTDHKLAYLHRLQVQPLPLESQVIGALKRLQILAYLLGSSLVLLRRGGEMRRMLPAALTLSALGLLWLGDVFDYLFDFGFGTAVDRAQMLALAVAVIILTGSALLRARLLPESPRGYKSPGLSGRELGDLSDSLDRLFRNEKPYLNPRLTLPMLAERLATAPHQVSRLLNEHYGANFSSFINRHRVEEAKRLLSDASARIADAAFASGFNSISTFNAAFKRNTGITPRQYREQFAASSPEKLPDS